MTPDMQDRIERAARHLYGIEQLVRGGKIDWDDLHQSGRDLMMRRAGSTLRLAFPELFDTPTHWIAPMVATEEMREAGTDARWRSAIRDANNVSEIFASMRTAYLNQKDSEG